MYQTAEIEEIKGFPSKGIGVKQDDDRTELDHELKRVMEDYSTKFTDSENLMGGKIILIGPAAVGKTCLFHRAMCDEYKESYKPTIGWDFTHKTYNMFGVNYSIQILDTAGGEQFQQFYRDSSAALVCFSMNSYDSLRECETWAREVRAECGDDVYMFLVGCKCDMVHVVERSEALKMARKLGAEYFETSAKLDKRVKPLFARATFLSFEKFLKKFMAVSKNQEEEAETIKIRENETSKDGKVKKGCCKK